MNSSLRSPCKAAACQGKATISNLKGQGLAVLIKLCLGQVVGTVTGHSLP